MKEGGADWQLFTSNESVPRAPKSATMKFSRAIEVLILGLSAMTVAEATFIDVNAVGGAVKGIQQRQNDENAKTDAGATTTTPPPKTTDPADSTTTSSSTSSTSTTQGKPPTTSSSTSSTSSASSTKTGPPSSTSSSESSTTQPPSSSSTPASSESTQPQTITKVITSTLADGSQVTMTSESVSTPSPSLANSSNSGQETGMKPETRNVVIGVVVGVGGAIILGGLALVAWRIWGRKKHQDENDGLMDYGSTVEKPETMGGSMAGRTPFQSTLESYHAPTQVNTAANF